MDGDAPSSGDEFPRALEEVEVMREASRLLWSAV